MLSSVDARSSARRTSLAAGKGVHGTDLGTRVFGGHLTSYEERWKDQAKYQTLNTAYAKIGTVPKACQDDAFQPDACKIGSEIVQPTR